jgi:cysteinyl-tRNA synthetase
MAIRVQDTLARQVVDLVPRDEGKISMYVCGPTVYNYIHIGNARTFLSFDLIRSYLRYRGFEVTYVMNYTDVDDKIIERAKIEGIPTEGITSKYSRAFEDDMAALGADMADVIVKATDHIEDMVEAIENLVTKGFAYEADGNVFYSVESFPDYGKLSGRSLDDLRAGERIEPHESKRNPLDFALWKSAKEGEPSWSSPWGPCRPGWHIECSVMSMKYLGPGFDIHGGGSDLVFPHHENEIAQAEALVDPPFVRHWLHAGMVQMSMSPTPEASALGPSAAPLETEKMSKSLGNIVLARDVAKRYPGEVARFWAITGSYRSQIVFSEDSLDDSANAYQRWRTFVASCRHALGDRMPERPASPRRAGSPTESFIARFIEAMDDDFNSAAALATVHDLVTEGNKTLEGVLGGAEEDSGALVALVEQFLEITSVLGFTFKDEGADSELVAGLVEYLLELREQAREEKAFERADAIRARLVELGVMVEDTAAGPRWRIGASGALEDDADDEAAGGAD